MPTLSKKGMLHIVIVISYEPEAKRHWLICTKQTTGLLGLLNVSLHFNPIVFHILIVAFNDPEAKLSFARMIIIFEFN